MKYQWSKVFDFTQDQADISDTAPQPTHEPNIGEYVELKGIPLEQEPLLWPFITVSIKDRAQTKLIGIGGKKGCEECFTTLSLLGYAADAGLIQDEELFYAHAQLNKN